MKDLKFLKENGVDTETSLSLFGDLETYNETMEDFLSGIDNKLQSLEKNKNTDELYNYAIFAHSIKSDARYLGFKTVADVALKHETAGKENNQHFILKDYDNLISNINEMINVIKRYLTEEPDQKTESKTCKKTILVADDSPLITNLIYKALSGEYNVVVASDGEEVISRLNSNIDILLLDLNMPNKNGFEVLEHLKQNNLFNNLRVSIITGDEERETITKAFTYPIVDMLIKPFSIEELKRIVLKTLQ